MARPSLFVMYARTARNADVPVADATDEGAASDNHDELAGSGHGHGPLAAQELALVGEAEPRYAEGVVQLWKLRVVEIADIREGLRYVLEPVYVACKGVRLQLDEGGVGRQVHVVVEMLLQLGDGLAGTRPTTVQRCCARPTNG